MRIDVGRFERHMVVMDEYVDEFYVPALVVLDAEGKKIAHLNCKVYEDRAKRRNDPHKLAEALKGATRPPVTSP